MYCLVIGCNCTMTKMGGNTHILRQTGMCRFSTRNPSTLAHILQKKSLNMGPTFWAQIFGFSQGENPENHKICEKWTYFSRKICNNGYPFLSKWPLKMGRVLRLEPHTPGQTKSEYPRDKNPDWFDPALLQHDLLPLQRVSIKVHH